MRLAMTLLIIFGIAAAGLSIVNTINAYVPWQYETLVTDDMQDAHQFVKDCFAKEGRPEQQNFAGGIIELKCSWKENK